MFRIDDFVTLAFVVFALTVLLKDTDGPAHLFVKFRDWLSFPKDKEPRKFFMELFACPWCVGTWISVVVSIIYFLASHCNPFIAIAYWLSSIGATGLLYAMLYSFVSKED